MPPTPESEVSQGHPFQPDPREKREWILELLFGNAGPSSQANLYKVYVRLVFPSMSLCMNSGVQKVEKPERQFSQSFLGCIFKERLAKIDMEKPRAWFHRSFLFSVNLAALYLITHVLSVWRGFLSTTGQRWAIHIGQASWLLALPCSSHDCVWWRWGMYRKHQSLSVGNGIIII